MRQLSKRAVCLLLAAVLCASLLPALGVSAGAATLAERQQALVAVALAYHDKGHSVQYDGTSIVEDISRADGGKTRSTNQVAPEYATPHETMYSVCSDFAHQVYWEAFHYLLTGPAGNCWTGELLSVDRNSPMVVYYWDNTMDKDRRTANAEMLAVAQPGDVFTTMQTNGGHTMVYVGDVYGDGDVYFAHCWGADIRKASEDGFADIREYPKDGEVDKRYGYRQNADAKGGAIRVSKVSEILERHYSGDNGTQLNLLRPLLEMKEEEYPIRPATKYRMSHPRLAIDRTLNKTRFNSAYTGETVTLTLKLSNSSKNNYTVPVTEKSPAGAKLKTPFQDASVSGETQTLNVELPAGESKTLICEYEITAKRGESVTFEGGSVGDIPSNTIPITVGGKKLTAEENARLAELADGKFNKLTAVRANATNRGDAVYQQVLGLNVQLPKFRQISKKLIKSITVRSGKKTHCFKAKDEVDAEDLTAYQTLVPAFWYGTRICYEWGIERCTDPRDMHLEPGDVICLCPNDSLLSVAPTSQIVYLGSGKYLKYNKSDKGYLIVEEPELVSYVVQPLFYVLRPTLAYDDVHALPALAEPLQAAGFKFKDVKESDWFYPYVKELVADGTVSGMSETEFQPNGTLTYGQALKLIALAVGEKEPVKSGSHWANGWLALAKRKGWLNGNVNLDGTITRLQLCRIAAKAKGLTAQPESNPFKDTSDKDVLALNKAGVISGMTATEFKPEGLLTRAQISKIIWTLRKV